MSKVICMFSGQGSQYYHMSRELFERNAVYRDWMYKLDSAAVKYNGQSVVKHIFDEEKTKLDPFEDLLYSHPAIFMVEYSLYQMMLHEGMKPAMFLGYSLGEFVSAVAAGCLSYKDALAMVMKHGELVLDVCREGRMMAVLGNYSLYDNVPLLNENSELAAVNFDSHFVLAGTVESIKKIENYLKEQEIFCQVFPLSIAFHSSYIDSAEDQYKKYVQPIELANPKIPLVSCIKGDIMNEITIEHFWDVTREPVLFQETIEKLEAENNYIYVDLGPSGTLATFVRNNMKEDSRSQVCTALTPFGNDLDSLGKCMREVLGSVVKPV